MERKVIWNIMSFLEQNKDIKIPLKFKILKFPEKITKEDLIVNGDLVFYPHIPGEQLRNGMLPDGLKINSNLYLSRQPHLTKLPDNLTSAVISLESTIIDEIPNNLKVNAIFLNGSILKEKYTDKQIYEIIKQKGGMVLRICREHDLVTVCTKEELYAHNGW